MSLLLEYGFNLSATREIARHRDQPNELARIVSSVTGAVALLAILSAMAALAALFTVPMFRQYPEYLGFAWLIGLTQAAKPLWYFQGVERLYQPAWLNMGARALVTAGIFIWVRTVQDGWKPLVLQIAGGALVAIISLFWLYREVSFAPPSLVRAVEALRMGWSMFLFRGAVSLYTTANAFILGLFVPPASVAFYGGAERLNKAVLAGLDPISQAIYPRITHLVATDQKRAARIARVGLLAIGGLGLALGLLVMAFAPIAVRILLGARYEAAIPVLRVLALLIPLTALSNVIGVQWMLPLGMDRAFNNVIVSAGILNVILAVFLAPRAGAVGMAISVVGAEAFVAIAMWWVLKRSGRQFWKG
jgi:PST family polysaccharide transporter